MNDTPDVSGLKERGFSPGAALLFARLASAAYLEQPDKIEHSLRVSNVAIFSGLSIGGFAARLGDHVVAAFRGTVSSQILNWLTNLDHTLIEAGNGRVHRGFARALDLISEQLCQSIAKVFTPGSQLWLTGHSLGGALAVLAGPRLASEHHVAGVYTFGSPRVGCPRFAACYPFPVHRVEMADDLVCHLPLTAGQLHSLRPLLDRLLPSGAGWFVPADAAYQHIGVPRLLRPEGVLCDGSREEADDVRAASCLMKAADAALRRGPATVFDPHSIDSYLAALARPSPGTIRPASQESPMNDLVRDKIQEVAKRFRVEHQEPRLLVVGQTGAGKSSLVNALFGKDLVQVSTIASCTRHFSEHKLQDDRGNAIVVVDSPGYGEVGFDEEYARNVVAEATRCHALTLVLQAGVRAYAEDLDIVRRAGRDPQFTHEKAILIALNQIDKVEPIEEWDPPYDFEGPITPAVPEKVRNVKEKVLLVGEQFRTIARGRRLRIVPMMASRSRRQGRIFNVDAFKMALFRILPEVCRYLFARAAKLATEASQEVLKELDAEADKVIAAGATAAGGAVALNPIPVSDFITLIPIQTGMVIKLGAIYGETLDAHSSLGVITALGAGFAARSVFQAVISFLPGIKNVVGGPYAAAATYGFGVAAKAYFKGQTIPSERQLRAEIENHLKVEGGH